MTVAVTAREADAGYPRRGERAGFTVELVDEARRLKGDPEASRVTEEWLAIENEAMELAESAPLAPSEATEDPPWWR